jgi:hypothetical protein
LFTIYISWRQAVDDAQVKAHLDAMEVFPETLKKQVQGLNDAVLRYRPAPDRWSIVEILGHLADSEALWSGRIRQILASEHPTLAAFDPAETARQRDYQNKQPNFLLITFAERRAEHLELLRMLRPIQLARTGTHPTRGQISVADAIAIMANHDRTHAEQISANLVAHTG